MKTVLGKLNRTYLENLLSESYSCSRRMRIAVAYADRHKWLMEFLKQHPDVQVTMYGLLDPEVAVSPQLLRWFLDVAPTTARCFLVNGHFHPKVIWWEGFGAYVGSANLTANGWQRNLEAGLFLTQEELEVNGVAEDLAEMFDYLGKIAQPLTRELLSKVEVLAKEQQFAKKHQDSVQRKFDELFAREKPHPGLIGGSTAAGPTAAEQSFVDEWRSTLELMRRLCKEFAAAKVRPLWVSPAANPTVHFDQFLHGYYYHYVEATVGGGKALDKVKQRHQDNQNDPDAEFRRAMAWWAEQEAAPTRGGYNEEAFINVRAPRMKELLSPSRLPHLTLDELAEALSHSHAFREHARHFDRPVGLSKDQVEPEDQKIRRATAAIWSARTREGGHDVLQVLEYLIYGSDPPEAERRLWRAIRSKSWRLPHLGPSTLGELIGWARPDDYPPRNDRNNMALLAMGYEVATFKQDTGN